MEGESERDKEKREKELAKPLRRVGLRKYSSVSPTAFPTLGTAGGKKRIVVLRTSGAIVGAWLGGRAGSVSGDSSGQARASRDPDGGGVQASASAVACYRDR